MFTRINFSIFGLFVLLIILLWEISRVLEKKKPYHLNIVVTTEQIILDPIKAKGYQQFQVLGLYLDNLVRKDSVLGIVSGIATSWKISEDQTEYLFRMDGNHHFHNGDVIEPKDVRFSLERHLKEGSPSIIGIYLKAVIKQISEEDHAIKIILRGAYPSFLDLLSMPGFGIISHKSTEENIIGSGPYDLDSTEGKTWCFNRSKSYLKPGTIERFCFVVERDAEKIVNMLNSGDINLAMGAPLETALSKNLKSGLVSSPFFSLVSTHAYLNSNKKFFSNLNNRLFIRKILHEIRDSGEILTIFDKILNSFFPKGLMPESYYSDSENMQSSQNYLNADVDLKKLKIVFPYGIFLQKTVDTIVAEFETHNINITYLNVKGKELLNEIVSGDFDIIFLPYQSVIPDPDGQLTLLEPNSLLKTAGLSTENLLQELEATRFHSDRNIRMQQYADAFLKWEKDLHFVPFSQNGIPIVYAKYIRLPDLNFSFHLNLRDLSFDE